MLDSLSALVKNPVFQTVVSGVLVFVLGQICLEYLFKPLQRYKNLRAKAAYNLVYFGNVFNDKDSYTEEMKERLKQAELEFRIISAELKAFSIEKPMALFWVPRKKKLVVASEQFMGLSNTVGLGKFEDAREKKRIIENVFKLEKAAK